MAKKHTLTTAEEIAQLETSIAALRAEIAPVLDAVKASSDIDKELCGHVGQLFDLTSKLSGKLMSLELSKKIAAAEAAGLI